MYYGLYTMQWRGQDQSAPSPDDALTPNREHS
jgi:hypothetical protein